MNESDKRIRREALKLLAIGCALGLLIGFIVGTHVAERSGDRILVVPLGQGTKVLGGCKS